MERSRGRASTPDTRLPLALRNPYSPSTVERVWMSSVRVCEEGSGSAVKGAGEGSRVQECHHSWWGNTKKAREGSQLHWDTVEALTAILDLSTHLHNYPTPLDTSLANFVVAKRDLYIPRQQVTPVQDTWPGCQVSYVEGGHVSATLLHSKTFQDAITSKMKAKLTTSTPTNHFNSST